MSTKTYRVDGILWYLWESTSGRRSVTPICPKHHIRMYPKTSKYVPHKYDSHILTCAECAENTTIARAYGEQETYVIDKIDSKVFKGMSVLNLDDEAIPLLKTNPNINDNKYFVKCVLTESKTGLRLVVYLGEKGKKEKSQIFVEPKLKRLAFDHNDIHPSELLSKLEATFEDGTKHTIKSKS